MLEDRVTGRQDFAGGQDHWIAVLVCGRDFAGAGLQDLFTRKLNADCIAVLHAVKMQISVLFIDSILLLQGQTSLENRNLLEDRVTG